MRIVFVTTMDSVPWGGSEVLWAAAANLAIQEGHQVFCSVYEWPEMPAKLNELKKKGATFYFKKKVIQQSISKRILRRIRRTMSKLNEEVKVIEAFNPEMICYSQGDSFSAAENENYQILNDRLKIPYVIISQLNYEFKKYESVNFEKALRFTTNAKKYLFVSRRNLETARLQLLDPISNGFFLNNPVYLASNEIIKYPTNNTFQFAVVARLDVVFKGQDLLMHVLSQRKWIERDWHLNLYGCGKDETYLALVIEYCKLQNRVTLHGQVSDVRQIWEQNHIHLMPSYAEGTPLALMESMVCGRTAVVTDVGGNNEVIVDDVTGFLAVAPTLKAFDQALDNAWKKRENWEKMGEAAHFSVLENIDPAPERKLLEIILS